MRVTEVRRRELCSNELRRRMLLSHPKFESHRCTCDVVSDAEAYSMNRCGSDDYAPGCDPSDPYRRLRIYRMRRGDTFRLQLQVIDDLNVNVDLTGAKVWATFKRSVTDVDGYALATLSTTVGGVTIVSPATSGQVQIVLPASATVGLADDMTKVIYDVQVRLSDGTVGTVDMALLEVWPDVTRDSVSA